MACTTRLATFMAELSIVGELVGAEGFSLSSLSCNFNFVAGEEWTFLEGGEGGQTHTDTPIEGDSIVWSHPIGKWCAWIYGVGE